MLQLNHIDKPRKLIDFQKEKNPIQRGIVSVLKPFHYGGRNSVYPGASRSTMNPRRHYAVITYRLGRSDSLRPLQKGHASERFYCLVSADTRNALYARRFGRCVTFLYEFHSVPTGGGDKVHVAGCSIYGQLLYVSQHLNPRRKTVSRRWRGPALGILIDFIAVARTWAPARNWNKNDVIPSSSSWRAPIIIIGLYAIFFEFFWPYFAPATPPPPRKWAVMRRPIASAKQCRSDLARIGYTVERSQSTPRRRALIEFT